MLAMIAALLVCASCSANQTPTTRETSLPDGLIPLNGDVILEQNDWSNIWVENANQSDLPRVLFVGDSITDGYYASVTENLQDQYYPARYTTSKFISNPDFQAELTTLLKRYDFEIILLNNGLHGWDYPISDYQAGLESLVRLLGVYEPEAILVWSLTTPVRQEGDLNSLRDLNAEVIRRNQAAAEVMSNNGIQILDLYQAMLTHPEYYKNDGLHFNETGRKAQAESVSEFLLDLP